MLHNAYPQSVFDIKDVTNKHVFTFPHADAINKDLANCVQPFANQHHIGFGQQVTGHCIKEIGKLELLKLVQN